MNDMLKYSENAAAQCFEACRGQFETSLALVNALAAGAERVRAMQLAAAQELQSKHAAAASKCAKAGSLQELMALQGNLLSDYYLGTVDYWSKLAALSRQTQAELATLLQKQGSAVFKQASASAAAGVPAAASASAPDSLVKIMQTAFNAARDANEAFVKVFTDSSALLPAAEAKKPAKAAARPAAG